MIVMQFDIDEVGESLLVIMIEPENFHRMEQADPITLETRTGERSGFLKPAKYPDKLRMVVAYEAEPGRFYEMIAQGRHADLIRDLMRGYKFEPQDGKRVTGEDWKIA